MLRLPTKRALTEKSMWAHSSLLPMHSATIRKRYSFNFIERDGKRMFSSDFHPTDCNFLLFLQWNPHIVRYHFTLFCQFFLCIHECCLFRKKNHPQNTPSGCVCVCTTEKEPPHSTSNEQMQSECWWRSDERIVYDLMLADFSRGFM